MSMKVALKKIIPVLTAMLPKVSVFMVKFMEHGLEGQALLELSMRIMSL